MKEFYGSDSWISNETLKAVLNSLSAHIAVVDKAGLIIAINKAWSDFAVANNSFAQLGLGKNYLSICRDASMGAEEAGKALKGISEVLSGERETFSIEYPCHSPQEKRWFLMNVNALKHGGATISHTNITAAKTAEDTILKHEQMLQLIIDTLPVGVVAADVNGKLFLSNKEAAAIWGSVYNVEPEDYNIYKGWFYDTGEPVTEWSMVKALTKGITTINEIIRIQSFDGQEKIISNSAVPVFDSGNKITGGIVVIEDITLQIKMSEQIKSSEKRFRSLIQNSSDVVILLDANAMITYVSPSIEKVVRFKPHELVGTSSYNWIHPDDLTILAKNQHEVYVQGLTIRTEVRVKHKYNDWIWVESIVENLLADPDVNAVVINYRNIEDRKKFENELIEVNKGKDKFFSIISHDLRGPFTSLLGFSDYISTEFETLTGSEVKHFASNINKSAKDVFNLIENLLQWSRFSTGKLTFTPERFNIVELLEQAIIVNQVSAAKKKIKLHYQFSEDYFVIADQFMIDSVIRNLISNAIKFTMPGGEVTVKLILLQEAIQISVTDNGIGMASDVLDNLFKLGEVQSTPGTADEKGSGLGLVMSKEFMDKNNGSLEVTSQPGLGTTFKINLPCAD